MSSISEVKPSQVNQLTAENAKLKEEIENAKLTKRNDYIHRKTLQRVTEEMITEITKAMQEVVDKVKEENHTLKQRVCDRNTSLSIVKEDNAKLKQQLSDRDFRLSFVRDENAKLMKKNTELKEEVSWWEGRSVLNLPMDEIDDDDMDMMDFK